MPRKKKTEEMPEIDVNAVADETIAGAETKAKEIIAAAEAKAADIVRKAKDSAKVVGDQVVRDAENRAYQAAQNAAKGEKVEQNAAPRRFFVYNGGVETGIILNEGDDIPEGYSLEPK